MSWLEQPFKSDPALLTHPNIPKPLHGINPRTVMGKKWWDEKRKEAYASTGYRCAACGIKKEKAKFHKWLEAHEYYDIDYENKSMKLIKIVPLCHACHNFIHSGRMLAMWKKGEYSTSKAKFILKSRIQYLDKVGVTPHWHSLYVYYIIVEGYSEKEAYKLTEHLRNEQEVEADEAWGKWYLEIDGQKFYSPYNSEEDWNERWN